MPQRNGSLKVLLWVAVSFGGLEFLCVTAVLSCLYLSRKDQSDKTTQGYMLPAMRFQEFRYADLGRATQGFTKEIGSGAGGTVYKGVLLNGRVAAIKRLAEADQGEAEFLAEVSTIGRLNHMNLIEMWGYCAQGKHRLLVYEFMEHGSLADNLSSIALDWEKRFNIEHSYGIVVLELVTGRGPTGIQMPDGGDTAEHGILVTWARERKSVTQDWVEETADPKMEGHFDVERMEVLLKVALQCVEEDKEARPTMTQVVEMLQSSEY